MDIQTKIRQSKFNCTVDILIDENNLTWFCAKDIGAILKLSNIYGLVSKYTKDDKCLIDKMTKGGPQKCLYISLDGLKRLIQNSRKVEANQLATIIGFDVQKTKYTCVESDITDAIQEVFKGEQIISQFYVGGYFIDLYFPRYNLAIECDEQTHKYKQVKDTNRQQMIEQLIPDIRFMRFNPHKKDFNMYVELNRIFTVIKNSP
jgi:very-short-patch-repair endonuclease